MRRLQLKIGAKLGITAGISIFLVAGIIANDHFARVSQRQSDMQAAAQQALMLDAVSTKAAVQGAQLALSQARSGRTIREIERAVAGLATSEKGGNTHIDSALGRVASEEARERINKIRARFADSLKAGREIAGQQKQILQLENERSDATEAWRRGLDDLMKAVAAAKPAKQAEIELALHNADSAFKDGRVAALQFQLTADEVLMATILRSGDDSTKALRSAQELAASASLNGKFEQLTGVVDGFRKTLEKIVDIEEAKNRMVRLRTNLIADEVMKLIDDLVAEVAQQSAASRAQADATVARSGILAAAVGAVVMLILLCSALFSFFNIARPIRRIGDVLLELAGGNRDVEIPYANRGDEVGGTARAAQTFRDQLVRMAALEVEQKAADEQNHAQRKTEMHQLADGFETAVGNVLRAVTQAASELEASAGTLTGTAESTQELSGTVARISEEASQNVHSVAAASDELSSSVSEIARQVLESTRIAGEAVAQAEKTDKRIGELLIAAQRIGDVVKLITAVAEQTNLLALNATIEAARAGEAGRGFAVVAQEVKALAAQTSKATDEIGGQINAIQSATKDSVAAIKEIGATINRISEIATVVAAAVEEQGAATQEISRNAQQAATGTSQVAENIAEVNRAATETGSASTQVLSAAQALSQEGSLLEREVGRFLATVRAA